MPLSNLTGVLISSRSGHTQETSRCVGTQERLSEDKQKGGHLQAKEGDSEDIKSASTLTSQPLELRDFYC